MKTNIWHYKLNKFWIENERVVQSRNTLCSYFWMTVKSCLKVLLLSFLFLLFVSVVVLPYFVYFVESLPMFDPTVILGLIVNVLVYGTVAWILIILQYSDYKEKYGWGKNKTFKEPNILVEYVKSKKRKICPIIEFED